MKKKIFTLLSCLVFCAVAMLLLHQFTDLLTPKSQNRYYILEKYLEDHPEQHMHDVQVFGSCHSYTSFNPMYLEQRTGASAFVYGNAGEIIPTTYVRMAEQFKIHTPKVALVEIWGINPYETYSSHPRVFGFYLANNLERTKLSAEKLSVIEDFDHMTHSDISFVSMHFPIVTYKERLMDGSLTDVDFQYSFEETKPHSTKYMFSEMTSRLQYNGFKKNGHAAIEDYPQKQKVIAEGEFLEIEPDIVEYIQKIIDLCKKSDVELIFYRSPYTSKKNELRKLNHLQQICDENDVLFIDTEAELTFNYSTDFLDYQHLSEIGANKATELLIPHIVAALEKQGAHYSYTGDKLSSNYLQNSDLTQPDNTRGNSVYNGKGENVDHWRTNYSGDVITLTPQGIHNVNNSLAKGWHLHQVIEDPAHLLGKTLTAVFEIEDFSGSMIKPVISCRNEEDKEITASSIIMEKGQLTLTCVVPENTKYIRVGLFAYEGVAEGDYVTLKSAYLYEGAYTPDILPAM